MPTLLEKHAAELVIVSSPMPRRLPFASRWANLKRALRTDPHLPTVLAVWGLCCLLLALLVYRYGLPWPWWNEWDLMVPIATGHEAVSLDWAMQFQNEYRAPLARLVVVGLGWLTGWNARLIHVANLAFLALSALALIRAVRQVRGGSAWSDMFLALLILSPWQYEAILWACTGPALPLALFGLAISLVLTGWPLRSAWHLWLYLGLVLAVGLSAGPVAVLWTAGLCGVVVRGWLGRRPRGWFWSSLLGTPAVLTATVAVNASPWLGTALQMGVGWLGFPLATLGPWALLALAVPGLYLMSRILRDLGRGETTPVSEDADVRTWMDLLIPLGAALGVAVVAGSGRYGPGNPWEPRFCSWLLPIGLMIYVLMVRSRAPQVLPGALAVLMAVSVGWSWRGAIAWAQATQNRIAGPVAALRKGQEPLSMWVVNNHEFVGYSNQKQLLEYLLQIRPTHRFIFRQGSPLPVADMGSPQVRRAATGSLSGSLRVVPDSQATGDEVVLADPEMAGSGMVALDVEVPADGTYQLCCRLQVPGAGHTVAIQVDDGPAVDNPVQPAPGYRPCMFAPVRLTAGKHLMTLKVARAGLRLDLLEIIPSRGTETQLGLP